MHNKIRDTAEKEKQEKLEQELLKQTVLYSI
jgi:hypothetical protein